MGADVTSVTPEIAVWEQRPNESAVAYQAFCTYRDMGYKRSLSKVARELSKSKPLMQRWSANHEWVERVEAWDREEDRVRLEVRRRRLIEAEDNIDGLATSVLEHFASWLSGLDAEKVQKMSPGQAVAIYERASKMKLLVLGGATENVKAEHSGAVAVEANVNMARRVLDSPEASASALDALEKITPSR